tara:strand:- start:447 stop:1115 length:669 start_codon:yes stop_codon:yes gene_type:complete
MLVIHYTGMKDFESALARLTDPRAEVSAHYLIDEDGETYRLVPEYRRAWHAGISSWHHTSDINGCSIGIELVNPGHEFGYRAFPEPQMAAFRQLAVNILDRHSIPPQRVLGHSDVAPLRRNDPGELFDWKGMAEAGIGNWPEAFSSLSTRNARSLEPGAQGDDVGSLQNQLAQFGYGIEATQVFDQTTMQVVTALQRHFRPARVDGVADPETRLRLAALVEG